MLNLDLKIALIRNFGSQVRASRKIGIPENKLSRIIQGHDSPSERQREILKTVLGRDYFSQESEGPRAA
jgi:predicted transcriptional regulator